MRRIATALVGVVLLAGVGTPAPDPSLVPLETSPEPGVTKIPNDRVMEFLGKWDFPPAPLGLPPPAH